MSLAFYDNPTEALREVWVDGKIVARISDIAIQDHAAFVGHRWHYAMIFEFKPGAVHGDINAIPLERRP